MGINVANTIDVQVGTTTFNFSIPSPMLATSNVGYITYNGVGAKDSYRDNELALINISDPSNNINVDVRVYEGSNISFTPTMMDQTTLCYDCPNTVIQPRMIAGHPGYMGVDSSRADQKHYCVAYPINEHVWVIAFTDSIDVMNDFINTAQITDNGQSPRGSPGNPYVFA
jgi:hypothetical protein